MRAVPVDRRPPHAVRIEVEMTAHDRYWKTRSKRVGNLAIQVVIPGPILAGSHTVQRIVAAGSRTRVPPTEQVARFEHHLEELRREWRQLETILVGPPRVVPLTH